MGSAPRIFALEGLIEIEHVGELVAGVRRLAHEQSELDERKDRIAEIGRARHAPTLEDDARHDAKPVEGEIPAGEGELAAGDMATLGETLLAELQSGKDEEVRALVEALLA